MRFLIYQESRQGARKSNQDRIAYSYSRDALIMVVADGMGGHLHGEIAAHIAVQFITEAFQRQAQPRIDDPHRFLLDTITNAHLSILEYAEVRGLLETPRTTCVACILQDGCAYWAHVGDSRLYLLRGGKVELTLSVIAQVQKMGGTAAFIDAENALDPQYAQKLGVKLDELLISQPDTGEQALEIADMLVRSGSVEVIVIDSVAALTPKAEIEGEMGEPQMGLQARLMSQALRKLTANIKRTNTLVIFINQIRMKIGVMFGSPETTTGGNALKFYASVRLDIRRIGAIKKGEEVVGSETRVKVVKNKVAPPFRQAEFDIIYGEGISREGEMLELGVNNDLMEKSGAWYSYKKDRIGQGKDNAREYLREHPDIAAELEAAIREKVGIANPIALAEAKAAAEDE